MRFRCPKCGEAVESAAIASGDRVLCGRCKTRLKLPAGPETVEALPAPPPPEFVSDPLPPPAPPAPPPAPPPPAYPVAPAAWPQPLVVPVPVPTESLDFTRERVEDMRDMRADRQLRRQHYLEDRGGNPLGTAGFALAVTAFVMLLSGAAFAGELKVYAWFMVLFGLPVALTALPCSVVGCLKAGAPRLLAGIGAGLGGFLMVVGYPALMVFLTNAK